MVLMLLTYECTFSENEVLYCKGNLNRSIPLVIIDIYDLVYESLTVDIKIFDKFLKASFGIETFSHRVQPVAVLNHLALVCESQQDILVEEGQLPQTGSQYLELELHDLENGVVRHEGGDCSCPSESPTSVNRGDRLAPLIGLRPSFSLPQ